MDLTLGTWHVSRDHRPLVVGILNRTRDSFYDQGRTYALDALLERAGQLVADGADVLEVGARPGGVDVADVTEDEEVELVCETVAQLSARFDVPLAVDTWRAAVAEAAFAEGVVLGNDMSGFSDERYLAAAAAAGATVVATHIRLAPQVPDPEPVYEDVVADVLVALAALVGRARAAGLPRERIVVDPGLDLGKTWQQSLELLAAFPRFAALDQPLLLAASNKIFLGRLLGLEKHERGEATVAACAIAALDGARLLRVHDARGARQAAELAGAVLGARRAAHGA
jgi:dihydropteroate synthase